MHVFIQERGWIRLQVQPHTCGKTYIYMYEERRVRNALTVWVAATLCNTLQHDVTCCNTLQHTANHSKSQQVTATHCYHTATRCSTLQHTATHCNILQHTATHCNTLQHKKPADPLAYLRLWSKPFPRLWGYDFCVLQTHASVRCSLCVAVCASQSVCCSQHVCCSVTCCSLCVADNVCLAV